MVRIRTTRTWTHRRPADRTLRRTGGGFSSAAHGAPYVFITYPREMVSTIPWIIPSAYQIRLNLSGRRR